MVESATIDRRVVVGVDGSAHARRALREAVTAARCRDAHVEAVVAWPLTLAWPGIQYGAPSPQVHLDEVRADHERMLHDELAALDTDVEVVAVVRQGPPAAALLDQCRGAQLLVVGSRGRGGFKGLVLGSVSQQVAGHAPCPVLVVP